MVFVSTNIEGTVDDNASAEDVAKSELAAGLALLQNGLVKIFYDMYDLMVPTITGEAERVFLTQSFDPTTHFETAIADVLEVFKRITGEELKLTDGPRAAE